MNKIETRAVIKHFCKKDFSFQNIHKDLLEMLLRTGPEISNWEESCEQPPGAGAPKTSVTKENIDLVHAVVLTDRRVTVRFIVENVAFP
jgi:hypothetical protein